MADITHLPMEQLQDLEYCIDSNPPWRRKKAELLLRSGILIVRLSVKSTLCVFPFPSYLPYLVLKRLGWWTYNERGVWILNDRGIHIMEGFLARLQDKVVVEGGRG
ncbi:hypothetical protein CK203_026337 [Vitis vinifera]|uniref:Uncharacterized protein n=1 Tax=Vitis vinifera TaxID=29760 RepID=A0A438IL71_VITVI|nr:hypothetical protein CK203_026337 [Vitis vinifera]